jgi:pimeloyl-ACP methyl ester carboxylesterase
VAAAEACGRFAHLVAHFLERRAFHQATMSWGESEKSPTTSRPLFAKRKSLFRMTTMLRALQVPTLVMAGRFDNVCVPAHLLADIIPNVTLEWIEDAGHMAPIENPGHFTARLQSFLAVEVRRAKMGGDVGTTDKMRDGKHHHPPD